MQLHKSDKAKLELNSRSRGLNLRQRSALFLADGVKTRHEMLGLLRDDGSMVDKLITDGYLIVLEGGPAAMPTKARAPLPPPAPDCRA